MDSCWNPVEIWPDKGPFWSLITSDDLRALQLPVCAALQMCLSRLCRPVCVCVRCLYLCVCLWSLWGISLLLLCVGFPIKDVPLGGVLTQKQFSALLSKALVWSRAAKCNWRKRTLKCAVIGCVRRLLWQSRFWQGVCMQVRLWVCKNAILLWTFGSPAVSLIYN